MLGFPPITPVEGHLRRLYRSDPVFSPSHYKVHSSMASRRAALVAPDSRCPGQAFGSRRLAGGGLDALYVMSVHVTVLIHFPLILTPSSESRSLTHTGRLSRRKIRNLVMKRGERRTRVQKCLMHRVAFLRCLACRFLWLVGFMFKIR